jgi:hypothetical protein
MFFFFGIKRQAASQEETDRNPTRRRRRRRFPDEIREKVNFLLYTTHTLYIHTLFIKGMKTKSLFEREKRKETTKCS